MEIYWIKLIRIFSHYDIKIEREMLNFLSNHTTRFWYTKYDNSPDSLLVEHAEESYSNSSASLYDHFHEFPTFFEVMAKDETRSFTYEASTSSQHETIAARHILQK